MKTESGTLGDVDPEYIGLIDDVIELDTLLLDNKITVSRSELTEREYIGFLAYQTARSRVRAEDERERRRKAQNPNFNEM